MKLNLSFARNSETGSLKRSLVKKLLTTAIMTSVMGAATLFYSSQNDRVLLQSGVADDGEQVVAEQTTDASPRGLTRQRSDFEKAINILAKAAESDPDLAEYYGRVQKRVRGEAAKYE